MTKPRLEEFQKNYHETMDSDIDLNEAQTRLYIIQPLLDIAGWDFRPDSLEVEVRTDDDGEMGWVDYLLKAHGSDVLLEAKKPGVILGGRHVEQIARYGGSEETDLCLLTNGIWVLVLDATREPDAPLDPLVGGFEIADMTEEHVKALSPDRLHELHERQDLLDQAVPSAEAQSLPEIDRSELEGEDEATVHVVTTNPDGVPYLSYRNAWGWVNFAEKPDYCAIYVNDPEQEIQFIGKVDEDKEMLGEDEWLDELGDDATYQDQRRRNSRTAANRVVRFNPQNLWSIQQDPIPRGDEFLRGSRKTTLGRFKAADTVGDL